MEDITSGNPSTHNPRSVDLLSILVLFVLVAWIGFVTISRHLIGFLASLDGDTTSRVSGAIGAAIQFILLSLPLLPLAILWPNKRYRSIFTGWLFASGLIIFLLPAYITLPHHGQKQAAFHIILTLLYLGLLFYVKLRRQETYLPPVQQGISHSVEFGNEQSSKLKGRSSSAFVRLTSIIIVITNTIPWLVWGALGSLLDTLLQGLFAFLLGLVVVRLLSIFSFQSLDQSNNRWVDYLLDGLSISTMLLIIASATTFAYNSMQLLLLIFIPIYGWTISAFRTLFAPCSKLIMVLFIGSLIAAPLIFIDADELVYILASSKGELFTYAFRAAFISAVVGLGFSISLLLIRGLLELFRKENPPVTHSKQGSTPNILFSGVSSFAVALILIISYLGFGQPGLFGERMFVVLKDQADVSSANRIADYTQRRMYVYKTLTNHAVQNQQLLRQTLDKFDIPYTPYYLLNAIEVPENPLLRWWLLNQPEVDRVLESPQLRPLPHPLPENNGGEPAPTETPWNIKMIGADRVWDEFGINGQGILIGQSDSGVQGDHPEISSSYRGKNGEHNYNWYDPWYHTGLPVDLGGHGTHTLGTILGKSTGVAPGAMWIACVNLARNLGNPALYLECMQFMLAPFPLDGDPFTDGEPALGAQILNNSWGCPPIEGCDPDTYRDVVQALRAAGIFIVASAGNDGPACSSINSPLPIYDEVFSVGAIDRLGNLAVFSSLGPVQVDGSNLTKPDITAPGVNILSSVPGSSYNYASGTSMAGPHVAGVVALIWSANPALIGQIEETEHIIIQTAQPYNGSAPDCPGVNDTPSNAYGYGIIDAYAAVTMALQK